MIFCTPSTAAVFHFCTASNRSQTCKSTNCSSSSIIGPRTGATAELSWNNLEMYINNSSSSASRAFLSAGELRPISRSITGGFESTYLIIEYDENDEFILLK